MAVRLRCHPEPPLENLDQQERAPEVGEEAVKAYLRSPDEELFDGTEMQFDGPVPEVVKLGETTFHRQDVRCGTANWTELWEEGYTPPNR